MTEQGQWSPEEVLAAAAAGDASALRQLYDDLAPAVHGYLRYRGAEEPEDLTSEVFLAVFPRLDSVTGGRAGLRSLVFSVAHARLVDDVRRRSRRPGLTAYDADLDARTTPSSEDEALHGIGLAQVTRLLDQLPEAQREVLELRHLADLSIEQVAELLGRTPGAVKQLQRRALLTLRDVLAREGVTP